MKPSSNVRCFVFFLPLILAITFYFKKKFSKIGFDVAFVEYIPSEWENEWWIRSEEWKGRECDILASSPHVSFVKDWLDASQPSTLIQPPGYQSDLSKVNDIFSTLRYRLPSGAIFDIKMEPLAGILRDPRLPCAVDLGVITWTPHNDNIQSKDFIFLDPTLLRLSSNSLGLKQRRVMLFDLGASTYNDADMPGLSWLYPKYSSLDLKFTDLYAWEVRQKEGITYFEGMPIDLSAATHFYNFGVDVDAGPDSPANPLAVLKQVSRKEDYVILKIDIEVVNIEEAVVEALLRDPVALELVDDLYWEHHVNIKSMKKWWDLRPEKEKSFADDEGQGVKRTMKYLRSLRSYGIRAHAWP